MVDSDVKDIGEKPDPINLMKNFSTQMGNGGGKSNNSEIGSKWFKEAQNSIFYCKEDANNT